MRLRVLLVSAATLVGVLPVLASATPPERHVALTYAVNGSAQASATGAEDRVTVTATDKVSSVVKLTLTYTSPDGLASTVAGCGSVSAPLEPGSSLSIRTGSGLCSNGQFAAATTGTLDFAFHHKPAPKATTHTVASATNRWAFLVGIRDYAGNTHSTVGGDGDILAIRKALLASGWDDSHILVMTEKQATATGIRNGLAWLVSHSAPNTFSLFHYSGHVCIASRGPCASGHTYLWSEDNRFISEDELSERIAPLQGFAWMDIAGCESGAFDNGFHDANHLFSSSSRGSETSYEDPKKKESIWVSLTWHQGYSTGNADKNGTRNHATMRQMAAYGAKYAPQQTKDGSAGPQHPQWAGGNPAWTLFHPPGT